MGSELSREEQEAADAAADARYEAEKAKYFDEHHAADVQRYRDMKIAKEKRLAEEGKRVAGHKAADLTKATDDISKTAADDAESTKPPKLVRSSKGDALPTRPVKQESPIMLDSDDDSVDLLDKFNPRKEPVRKAAASSGVENEFVGFGNLISTQETAVTEVSSIAKQHTKTTLASSTSSSQNVANAARVRALKASSTNTDKSNSSKKPVVPQIDTGAKKPKLATANASAESASTKSSNSTSVASAKRPAPSPPAEKRQDTLHKAPKTSSVASPQSSVSGLAALPKILKKQAAVSSKQVVASAKRTAPFKESPEVEQAPTDIPSIKERPPEWYNKLGKAKSRGKDEANADTLLRAVKEDIKASAKLPVQDAAQWARIYKNIRTDLHKVAFQPVSAQLLRSNRMLHEEDGLSQLFDEAHFKRGKWPFDIMSDAQELYNKWYRQVFETDLLRGIIRGKPSTKKLHVGKDEEDDSTVDRLDPAYKDRVYGNFHGNGLLLNGQWWPTQLCTVRDGAHSHTIQGISGNPNNGAYSCIMAGGKDSKNEPYPDEDHGEWILYCGTESTDGKVTEATQRMLESEESKKPIRLIRSSKVDSQWAPQVGLRYDGLYVVASHENLDHCDSTRQRHRFKLLRVPGQDPIRGTGPEKRPTQQEMEAYKKDKKNRGYT